MEEGFIKQVRSYFNKFGLGFFIGTIIVIAMQYGFSFACEAFFPSIAENYNLLFAGYMIATFFIAYPLLIVVVNKILKGSETIEDHKLKFWQLLVIFIISFAALYLGNIVGTLINLAISAITKQPVNNVLQNVLSGTNIWTQIIIVVILGPISEELIFRKLLIGKAIKYGEGTAIVLSALMFSLFHGNISQGIYAFALGFIFAYVYIRTGRIRYTIGLHMCINFVGSVIPMLLMNVLDVNALNEALSKGQEEYLRFVTDNVVGIVVFGIYSMVLFLLVVTGISLAVIYRKKYYLVPKGELIPKGYRFKSIILNPGMCLYIILWVAMYILAIFMV